MHENREISIYLVAEGSKSAHNASAWKAHVPSSTHESIDDERPVSHSRLVQGMRRK